MSRLSQKVLTVVLGLILLLSILWMIGLGTPDATNLPRFFSTKVWRESAGPFDQTRCSMVFDLRHRVGIVGKTRGEIEQLLGPPNLEFSETTEYVLCPSMVDYHMLEIRWKEGRSTGSRIIES